MKAGWGRIGVLVPLLAIASCPRCGEQIRDTGSEGDLRACDQTPSTSCVQGQESQGTDLGQRWRSDSPQRRPDRATVKRRRPLPSVQSSRKTQRRCLMTIKLRCGRVVYASNCRLSPEP